MSEQRTYVPYTPDDLIKMTDPLAALLACKLNTFADEKGAVLVSFSFLANLWGQDERKLIKAAKKLSVLDIWHYKSGDGRGHVTEWIKGANYDTFVALERGQILQIKVAKIAPNNKDIIKIDNQRVCTRKINQSKRGLTNAGDTPAPPEVMGQFEQFWRAFFFGSYAKYEKEQTAYKDRAAAAWRYLPAEKRERLLGDIKAGRRWDKTPWVLWYIQNYEIPMPIWYNGDDNLTHEMVDKLLLVKYKGRTAYIKPEDKDAWISKGARMFNN